MSSYELADPATGLDVLVKQPSESRPFRMDFSSVTLGSPLSSVLSASVVNRNQAMGSEDVVLSGAAIEGDQVVFTLSGGTNQENYKVTIKVQTADGAQYEGDGMLYVREF